MKSAVVLLLGAVFFTVAPAAAPVLQIGLATGAQLQTVFDFTNSSDTTKWVRCGSATGENYSHDFPDNPIRPFIGPDGNVWLWASNSAALCTEGQALTPACYGSYIKEANADLSGPALGVDQCRVGFRYSPITPSDGNEQASLASLNNLHWLLEFWAAGVGRSFQATAIIQNDFHGEDLSDCGSTGLGGCRYTNLVTGSWSQLLNQFVMPVDQNNYVTSPLFVTPYKYYPTIGEQGVNAQTNILYIRNLGDRIPYYYMLINESIPTDNNTAVISGLCLFRTSNVSDPNSWLGWNAITKTFSVTFHANPYLSTISTPQNCSFVLPSQYRYSLEYSPQYKTFIAVGVGNASVASDSKVVYATTQDLTNWGDPSNPSNTGIMWRNSDTPSYVLYQLWTASYWPNGNLTDAEGYFGLIDPTSNNISHSYFGQPDNNFQFVGNNPYLYMVYFHKKGDPGNGGSVWKDVVRLPLQITCSANCPT